MSFRSFRTQVVLIVAIATTATAQLEAQVPQGRHTALVDVDGAGVRDDDFARNLVAILAPGGNPSLLGDGITLFGPCFSGGMLDDLQTAIGTTFPWVGGSSAQHDEISWGQGDETLAKALVARLNPTLAQLAAQIGPVDAAIAAATLQITGLHLSLRDPRLTAAQRLAINQQINALRQQIGRDQARVAPFKVRFNRLNAILVAAAQKILIAKPPHNFWTKALLPELKKKNRGLLDAVVIARRDDLVGVNGNPHLETGQTVSNRKGRQVVLEPQAGGTLYAILWAGQGNFLHHRHDIDEVRNAILSKWKAADVEMTIFYGDGRGKDSAGAALPWPVKKATGAALFEAFDNLDDRFGGKDKFLFYATGHGMIVDDPPPRRRAAADAPERILVRLTPRELDAMILTLDNAPRVTIDYDVPRSGVGVWINGALAGELLPDRHQMTFGVSAERVGTCNVIELQGLMPSDHFTYEATATFSSGPLDPALVAALPTAEDEDGCPAVTMLTPPLATALVGESHVLDLQVVEPGAGDLSSIVATLTVIDGPNAGSEEDVRLDAHGAARFTYVGDGGIGSDRIQATFTDVLGIEQQSNVVSVAWSDPAPARTCSFDTHGDGTPDIVLGDADGDDLCDWPDLKTDLHGGALRFTTETPVEFHGKTIVEAGSIVVEEGATVVGSAADLRALTLMATVGDVVNRGQLVVTTSDDLTVTARAGGIDLAGATTLGAADLVRVDARSGDLVVAPSPPTGGGFTLLGTQSVSLFAKGARGGIRIAGARIGGRRVTIDTVPNTIPQGPKGLRITGGLVTSEAAAVGFTGSPFNVTLKAARGLGPLALVLDGGATIASGYNTMLATPTGERGCLSGNALLSARGGLGYIDLSLIRFELVDDGTTRFVGTIRGGDRLVAGTCP